LSRILLDLGGIIIPTTSYIKIFGPPVLKAIRELSMIAIDMPEVCIMDSVIASTESDPMVYNSPEYASGYFSSFSPAEIEVERCSNIISKSGERLGDYDFFFEWFTDPTMDHINQLLEKIDEALTPLGCRYTITTKK
jgi:hypothetical protein